MCVIVRSLLIPLLQSHYVTSTPVGETKSFSTTPFTPAYSSFTEDVLFGHKKGNLDRCFDYLTDHADAESGVHVSKEAKTCFSDWLLQLQQSSSQANLGMCGAKHNASFLHKYHDPDHWHDNLLFEKGVVWSSMVTPFQHTRTSTSTDREEKADEDAFAAWINLSVSRVK